MSLRHRRNDARYSEWRRNCSWNRRLSIGSFEDNNHHSYSRPLLRRNSTRYNYTNYNYSEINMQSNADPQNNVIPNGARGKWRNVAWNLVSKSMSNVKSELINVVTSNLVEFAVAVVTAYVSNWMFG